MRYTVIWVPAALSELARLWNDAEDRTEVATASDEIDRQLAPGMVGESRSGNARVLFAAPLAIDYEVIKDDRMVTVFTVWRTP